MSIPSIEEVPERIIYEKRAGGPPPPYPSFIDPAALNFRRSIKIRYNSRQNNTLSPSLPTAINNKINEND